MATFDTRRDTFPGQALPAARSFGPAGSRDERVKRVLRVLGITMSQFKKRFSKGRQTVTEADLAKAERAAAVVGTEYKTKKVDYDAHFGGTGTKLAQPIEVANKLDNDANDLAYRLKRFKRELNQSIDSRTRLRDVERTGTLPESTRPVQLVRECSTAGPGWSYCDRTVEGQCPDEKDIVGTPYENVYSSIGQPPNNKIVQCVPPELVRLGKTASKSEEEQLNKRFYNAVSVISKEAENIRRLSQWRETAPCGAIPSMAFAKNDSMCDRLHFKDDRGAPRCMTWNTAAKLGHGKQKELAESAKNDDKMRTCFANPSEITRKINADIRALELLRQKLRGAVEQAMKVSNFSTRFNLLATRLSGKYSNRTVLADGAAEVPVPFTWSMVKDYMLSTPASPASKDGKPNCDKTKQEYSDLKRMMQRRQLGGGGFPAPPEPEESPLEGGGGATFGNECGEGNHCGERIRYVLQLMDSITKKEKDIRGGFQEWKISQEALLNQLEKDTMCNKHGPDENWCENMQETCNYDCTKISDVNAQCIKVGNEWVDKNTQGATWDVDDFTAEGYPIGFRWLVPQDVRRLYSDFKQMGEYTCNAKGRLTQQEHKDLKRAYTARSKKIDSILSHHFPKTHGLRKQLERDGDINAEEHAMRAVEVENMTVNVVKALAERLGLGAASVKTHNKIKEAMADTNKEEKDKKLAEAAEDAQTAVKVGNMFNEIPGAQKGIDELISGLSGPVVPDDVEKKMDIKYTFGASLKKAEQDILQGVIQEIGQQLNQDK